jgi:maltose alpha-D-glucosyltransferase/alpha-amylase
MQWSADRNAGFSRANPQRLYLPVIIDPAYHFETVNVENQEQNLTSFLWWMKRVIKMRKDYKAFGRGSIEFLHPDNPKILAFLRKYEQEIILVVVNLSRFSQVAELDLSRYTGYTPVEIFSKISFPVIQEKPYVMTMGFHDYFWFILQKEEELLPEKSAREIPVIKSNMDWTQLFNNQIRAKIENQVLPPFLREQRWFGSKAQKILKINISEVITVKNSNGFTIVLIIKVNYAASAVEYYHLPLSFLEMEQAKELLNERPQSILFYYQSPNQEGIIYDGVLDEEFHRTLLQLVARRRVIRAWDGKLKAYPGKYFRKVRQFISHFERSKLLNVEQSNSSILYDRQLIFKLFRKLDEGTNPDLEMVKYITEKTDYKNVPAFAGALEYQKKDGSQTTLGILYPYVASEGNAWDYTQDHLTRYYERVLSQLSQLEKLPALPASLFEKSLNDMPEIMPELIGAPFLEMTYLLGKRTAELHQALAGTTQDPNFKPESFSLLYQRSIFQSIQSLIKRVFLALRKNYNQYPEAIQNEVKEILSLESKIITYCREILAKKIEGKKIRIHGDYHLGQVLYTGNDFTLLTLKVNQLNPWVKES